jgi:hypothetical protein
MPRRKKRKKRRKSRVLPRLSVAKVLAWSPLTATECDRQPLARVSHQHADHHEGDQDQQLDSSQGKPSKGGDPRLGTAAGVESVSRAERRAAKQRARQVCDVIRTVSPARAR